MHRRGSLQTCGLLLLFFIICFGLGYPILNRYDPRDVPGLPDVRSYSAIAAGQSNMVKDHTRFRVLVPWIAVPFSRWAAGRIGTWNPIMFGLLVSDSLFVGGTALLIVLLGRSELRNDVVALVAALLYLLNFATPNLRLAGLVDAGEGFFLLLLLWILYTRRFWALPVTAALGALTKETFVPFSGVFLLTWWIGTRKLGKTPTCGTFLIAVSCFSSVASLMALHVLLGAPVNPVAFGLSLHQNQAYLSHFASSLSDRNFWFIFVWLLPLGVPRLHRLPQSWLVPTGATAMTSFILDAYYGGAPGTIGRALFSIAGPLLCLSVSLLICGTSGS